MMNPLASTAAAHRPAPDPIDQLLAGIVRAFGGAIIFAVPTLMTMEVWWLGFTMEPLRLALTVALALPLLAGFSYFSGFKPTIDWREDIIDAFVAVAVGFLTAAALLPLLGAIHPRMSWHETIGTIALEGLICSLGAMLARSQFGGHTDHKDEPDFGGHLFLALIGALSLSLNIAPTEEVVLIAHRLGMWQQLGLLLLTLVLMHALLYAASFKGSPDPRGASVASLLLRSTVPSYVVSLLACLYLLWSFGRIDGVSLAETIGYAVVLGLPAGLGAAAARMIL